MKVSVDVSNTEVKTSKFHHYAITMTFSPAGSFKYPKELIEI